MFQKIGCFIISCVIALTVVSCGRQAEPSKSEKADMLAEKSYTHDAPVYQSIEQLTADADYVFQGTLTEIEKVQGASWYWEVYTITDLYKGIEAQDRIRLVGSPEDEGAAARNVGSEYLVFATVYELPVYPYPLINPIYNQAIFEVGGDGKLTFANNVEQQMLPAVFDEQFAADYRQIVTSSAGLTKKNPLVRVVNEYWDMSDLLTHSDLVVRVTFSEVEFINQYVSIGKVDKIIAEYGSVPTAKLPKTIGVNEDVKVGEEYLIFLQFDSQQDSLLLAARHGAIVDSSDGMRWNEVIHLLEEKS